MEEGIIGGCAYWCAVLVVVRDMLRMRMCSRWLRESALSDGLRIYPLRNSSQAKICNF
jgi:hypothetical protein